MSVEVLQVLRSIDNSLKELVLIARQKRGGGAAASSSAPAPDRDLDGKYGDPVVKFHPRDWHGQECKGLKFSQCPVDFLDMLAETFDYFADKAEKSGETTTAGKPVAPYKRQDAARARGWAARLRSGTFKPQANGSADGWGDVGGDDAGF
jgi:hypothetical protein